MYWVVYSTNIQEQEIIVGKGFKQFIVMVNAQMSDKIVDLIWRL